MTIRERLQFAEMCSRDYAPMTGAVDSVRFSEALNYARAKRNTRLYRYRSVSVYSLEELLFGYIYAGPVFRFNDPLDCKPIVDKEMLLSLYKEMYPDNELPESEIRKLLDEMTDSTEKWFREAAHIACLSEDYDNELMWSHYAKSHTGFVLGYDFPNDPTSQINQLLYPVIYTDNPLSVCKEAAIDVAQDCHAKQTGVAEKAIANNYWNFMTALIKRECWHYEKEWRLVRLFSLDGGQIPEHFQIWKKPSVIYYGNNIDINDEIRLHTYAILNGLQEYKMQYVYEDGSYKLKAVPYTSDYDKQCRKFITGHYHSVVHERLKRIEEYIEEQERK